MIENQQRWTCDGCQTEVVVTPTDPNARGNFQPPGWTGVALTSTPLMNPNESTDRAHLCAQCTPKIRELAGFNRKPASADGEPRS